MSEIDGYSHHCLGIISCPSPYVPSGYLALYRFDSETTNPNDSFQAKRGDVLMGGGRGEHGAVRIAIPEAFLALTHDDWDEWESYDEIVKAYWSVTQAYALCEGFKRVGWGPKEQSFESWLCEHIMRFLVREYGGTYANLIGPHPLEQDGSICRLPTKDERTMLDPFENR
jgi:hypothetical protein